MACDCGVAAACPLAFSLSLVRMAPNRKSQSSIDIVKDDPGGGAWPGAPASATSSTSSGLPASEAYVWEAMRSPVRELGACQLPSNKHRRRSTQPSAVAERATNAGAGSRRVRRLGLEWRVFGRSEMERSSSSMQFSGNEWPRSSLTNPCITVCALAHIRGGQRISAAYARRSAA